MADEIRDHYELTQWIKLKARQGHAALPDWSGPLPGIPKANCRQGLLPGVDPLDDSDDS
jgi:hypothetical protein